MGTFERVNLFYGVGHEQVYANIDWEDEHNPRNSPVRPDDAYGRLDGGVYWDFQYFLGVDRGPVWRRFITSPRHIPRAVEQRTDSITACLMRQPAVTC